MNRIYLYIMAILLFSCSNTQKQRELEVKDCDNRKLVNYIFPIDNFVKEKTLVYSLKSNRDSLPEIFKKHFKLKVDKDSLLIVVLKNAQEKTVDSSIFIINDGIPKTYKIFSKVDFYPNLLLTKKTIIGNRFCEFTTYKDIYEYTIPSPKGEVINNFTGYVTHKKYVTKKFKGIEYNCAILESDKELTVKFNGGIEKIKGISIGCSCKNLGELYSIVTLENDHIVEQKLIDIIEH